MAVGWSSLNSSCALATHDLLPWEVEHCGWSLLQAKLEVQKLINKAQDGALEAQPGRSIMESFEAQVSLPKCVQLHRVSFSQLPASSTSSSRISCVKSSSFGLCKGRG